MQKDALWKAITTKNPKFLVGSITLPASGLKKLFDLAWDEGHKQGVEDAKERDPFAGIFGGKLR